MTIHARVVVIGGGIVGVSTLYHLAKAGVRDALLVERRDLTAGATWHAAGNVHTQSAYANLSALQAYSLRLYDGLAEEVGQDVGSHVVGGFFLAQTKERMTEFKHLAGKFRGLGLEYDLVSPQEIRERHPLVHVDDLEGGAWDPEEGYVDPYSVTMGLAAGARKHGARILRHTQIEAIDRLPSGAWRLSAGETVIECEVIVNCAGFWASEVAEMVGVRLPITNMEHQYLVTETMPEVEAIGYELPMIRDTDSQYYLRQEGQGLLLGPWEKACRTAWESGRAPWSFGQELFPDDWDRLADGLGAIFHRIPALNTAGIKRGVNGAISFAPDGRPMIGPLPGVPDFFIACGFLGGIAQAGGIGLAMSQWILEGEPERDLHFIDVARFGNWTTAEFARERTHEILPLRYEIIYPGLERNTGRNLKQTPIHKTLVERGAIMGQIYGWERPLWFAPPGDVVQDIPSFERPNWWSAVGQEALALASDCGLIEMSTYGMFSVSGPGAEDFLNWVGSATVPLRPGKVALSLLLNPRGGIVGDVTIDNRGDGSFALTGATAGVAIYQRWLEAQAGSFDVEIINTTNRIAALGLAGPRSRAVLNGLSGGAFTDFPFMTAKTLRIAGAPCRALRVSYSGELGWEIHMDMEDQPRVFEALCSADPTLVGSRALNMLRLEKGYRSWGHEMTTEITPAAAGLARFCSKSKDYIGREAVERERNTPPRRRCVTLALDARTPPCWGTEPVSREGKLLGYVTSGGMGWRIGRMLAVAWIDASEVRVGDRLSVQILLEDYPAEVVADPVYDPKNERLMA